VFKLDNFRTPTTFPSHYYHYDEDQAFLYRIQYMHRVQLIMLYSTTHSQILLVYRKIDK